jgi:hypothetical protein
MIFIVTLCAGFFTYPSHYEKAGGMQFANRFFTSDEFK